MTVKVTLKKQGLRGTLWYKTFSVDIGSGDTTFTIDTQWRRILHAQINAPQVTGKYVTRQQVSGGTITYTVIDPGEAENFTVSVESDQNFK
jgi:hypothetical protein